MIRSLLEKSLPRVGLFCKRDFIIVGAYASLLPHTCCCLGSRCALCAAQVTRHRLLSIDWLWQGFVNSIQACVPEMVIFRFKPSDGHGEAWSSRKMTKIFFHSPTLVDCYSMATETACSYKYTD